MRPVAFRPVEPSDLVFIERSYLDSCRTSRSAGLGPVVSWSPLHKGDGWYERELAIWQAILSRPGVGGVVAHKPGESPESRADIYGYLLFEDGYKEHEKPHRSLPYVVFSYIKSSYRKPHMRIEERLFAEAGIDPTEPFHYAVKNATISRNPLFRNDSHKPLHVRFPPSKTNPERP